MKDRIPEPGKENRVRIRQDNGQIVEGVLEYADNASRAGSTYCRANVLPDSVCDYLGLSRESAEPKDAFAKLEIAKITFNNFSTGNTLQKKSSPTSLSTPRVSMAAATIGNHALFAGGNKVFTFYDNVDGYTESLTRKVVTALSQKRCNLAATVANGSALFAGGTDTTETYSNVVNAYNESLTMTTITALSTAREGAAATAVGNYALFAGGNNESPLDTVDAYNASLTRSTPTALSQKRNGLAAATIGSYALFAGGRFYNNGPTTYFDVVDAYNTSLTRTLASSLSAERWQLGSTVIGGYALFAGGQQKNTSTTMRSLDTVDAYTASLTRSTPTVLSTKMSDVIGVTVGTHALFTYTTGVILNDYDASLVRTIPAALTTIQRPTSAATVGRYALFAGGQNSSGDIVSTIEAYEAFAAEIPIPSFSKYYFDGVTESEKTTILGTTLKSAVPLTGYIEKITELSGTMSIN